MISKLAIHPLTEDRFGDLEKLFGPAGACAGCWCMFFRVSAKDWSKPGPQAERSNRNRKAFKRVVAKGAPGLVAYEEGEPVGTTASAWGLLWGGDFPRLKDGPHLELPDTIA